jgi:hypothetical protein
MAENRDAPSVITVHYDQQSDILAFAFARIPQPAVAEEAADDEWV